LPKFRLNFAQKIFAKGCSCISYIPSSYEFFRKTYQRIFYAVVKSAKDYKEELKSECCFDYYHKLIKIYTE